MSDAAAARREYMREYKRKQRAEARAKHLCIVCVKNSVDQNAVCDECIGRSIEWERSFAASAAGGFLVRSIPDSLVTPNQKRTGNSV